jgi:hypothetical protein
MSDDPKQVTFEEMMGGAAFSLRDLTYLTIQQYSDVADMMGPWMGERDD